jgi:hypothetical protein
MTHTEEAQLFRATIKELITVSMILFPDEFKSNETGLDDKSVLAPVKAGYLASVLIEGMPGPEGRQMAIRNYTHASDRLRAFLDGGNPEAVV